jgi:tungstate transport system substrate-binding protein
MHDHFCLAGPINDPAGLSAVMNIRNALRLVAERRALFHSRADSSATMWKERALCEASGMRSYISTPADWYKMSQYTPSQALIEADAAGAYLLTDRSTLLHQVREGNVSNTTVLFESKGPKDILMNSCYALSRPNRPPEVGKFLEYITSQPAQEIIKHFGEADVGMPLFAAAEDRYFSTSLRLGRPRNRRWVRRGILSPRM